MAGGANKWKEAGGAVIAQAYRYRGVARYEAA